MNKKNMVGRVEMAIKMKKAATKGKVYLTEEGQKRLDKIAKVKA